MIQQIMGRLSKKKKREHTPVRASPMSLAKLTKLVLYLEEECIFNKTTRVRLLAAILWYVPDRRGSQVEAR